MPVELRAGAELADGRYTLTRPLGQGGMAVVWLAEDHRLGRPVAVKLIATSFASDPDHLTRFTREARLAAGVAHPNLVDVYDHSADPEQPYIVMEFVPGGTLGDRLRAGQTPAPAEARAIARDLLEALDTIHRTGILHRDVKPANVLLAEDGRVKLTDFGIARDPDATGLTRTGHVIGTLNYLAPEVVAGAPASRRSDLYALGRLLQELGDPGLAPLAARLTDQDPARRPRNARDALRILDPPPQQAWRPPAAVVLAALGAVLVLLAVVLALSGDPGGDTPLDGRLDAIERVIGDSRRPAG